MTPIVSRMRYQCHHPVRVTEIRAYIEILSKPVKLIDSCFNSTTFGNELKPAYNFDPNSETLFTINTAARELLDYAKEHDMPVRGHVLVWHSQVDPTIFAIDYEALSDGKVTHDYNAHIRLFGGTR